MRKTTLLVLSGLALLCVSLPASADYLETFDSYAAGSTLIGQGGWVGYPNESWNTDANVVNAQSHSGGNSMMVHSGGPSGYGTDIVRVGNADWILKCRYTDPFVGDNDGIYIQLNGTAGKATIGAGSADIIRDQWVLFEVDLNLDTRTGEGFYNGVSLGTFTDYGDPDNHAIAAFDIWTYGGFTDANPVYYDDFSITPEPATMALLCMGGLALLRRRSRR